MASRANSKYYWAIEAEQGGHSLALVSHPGWEGSSYSLPGTDTFRTVKNRQASGSHTSAHRDLRSNRDVRFNSGIRVAD